MKNLPKPRTRINSVRGKKGILIAFGELFLKSRGVKNLFLKRLVWNLGYFLKKEKLDFKVHLFHDRIFLKTEQTKKAAKIIKRIFGISWLAESYFFEKTNLKDLSAFVEKNYQSWIKKGETFAVKMKKYDRKSIEEVAKNINRKVDLKKPKRKIFIENNKNNNWFLYFKKQKGAGGFPSGASGKVLTLISGGIDSPVAAYLISKKGAQNIWLHFHSFPLVSNKSIEKVKELAKIILNYQPRLKIYFVPFQNAQVEIKLKVEAKYRILLYRRLMLKIAEQIAKKENCLALVTGESLGQVSSQTLFNLKNIEEAVKIPVLRPLISLDKEEIIEIARKIGTFNISIKLQEDCCTLFTSKHATAEGRLEMLKDLENQLNIKRIVKSAVKEAQIIVL